MCVLERKIHMDTLRRNLWLQTRSLRFEDVQISFLPASFVVVHVRLASRDSGNSRRWGIEKGIERQDVERRIMGRRREREVRQKSRSFAVRRPDVLSRASFSKEVPNLSCLMAYTTIGACGKRRNRTGVEWNPRDSVAARCWTSVYTMWVFLRENELSKRSRIMHAGTLYEHHLRTEHVSILPLYAELRNSYAKQMSIIVNPEYSMWINYYCALFTIFTRNLFQTFADPIMVLICLRVFSNWEI